MTKDSFEDKLKSNDTVKRFAKNVIFKLARFFFFFLFDVQTSPAMNLLLQTAMFRIKPVRTIYIVILFAYASANACQVCD